MFHPRLLLAVLALAFFTEQSKGQTEKPHYFGRAKALCIGIDQYRFVSEIEFAESDAKSVAHELNTHYGFATETLLGAAATKRAILSRLEELRRKTDEQGVPNPEYLGADDVFVLFFAGHGQVINTAISPQQPRGREGFLLPYDARLTLENLEDVDQWQDQAIDMQKLLKQLGALDAKHVLVLLDACCSGFMTQRGTSIKFRPDLQFLLNERSLAVISATTENQGATWSRSLQHGFFTASLLNELTARANGRDPASVTDLFENIRFEVAKATKSEMIPQMNSRLRPEAGEFVFLPKSIPTRDIDYLKRFATKAGPEAIKSDHVLASVLKRALDRTNLRTQTADLIRAYEALDYRFSDNAPAEEAAWRKRYQRYFENAASADALAISALSLCYAKGLGIEASEKQALRWSRLAYETETAAGQFALARCYLLGIDTPKNLGAAEQLLRDAAKAGDPLAQLELGRGDFEPDSKQRLDWLRKAATAGVSAAKLAEAKLRMKAISTGEEPAIAAALAEIRKLLTDAANAGYPPAAFELFLLNSGERNSGSLQIDFTRGNDPGSKELIAAAKAGFAPAQAWLAWEYFQEAMPPEARKLQLPKDPRLAVSWAERAVAQNNSWAAMLLCNCYLTGAGGTVVDHDKARKFCEVAASANDALALKLQGIWYADGSLYERDAMNAKSKFEQAAMLGNAESSFMLGVMYENGSFPARKEDVWGGISIHKHHALRWFVQGAKLGNAQALAKVKAYATQIKGENVVYYRFFERDYPQQVAEFRSLTGR